MKKKTAEFDPIGEKHICVFSAQTQRAEKSSYTSIKSVCRLDDKQEL